MFFAPVLGRARRSLPRSLHLQPLLEEDDEGCLYRGLHLGSGGDDRKHVFQGDLSGLPAEPDQRRSLCDDRRHDNRSARQPHHAEA